MDCTSVVLGKILTWCWFPFEESCCLFEAGNVLEVLRVEKERAVQALVWQTLSVVGKIDGEFEVGLQILQLSRIGVNITFSSQLGVYNL